VCSLQFCIVFYKFCPLIFKPKIPHNFSAPLKNPPLPAPAGRKQRKVLQKVPIFRQISTQKQYTLCIKTKKEEKNRRKKKVSRRRPRVRGLEKLAFSIFIGVAHTKKETANLKTKSPMGVFFLFAGPQTFLPF